MRTTSEGPSKYTTKDGTKISKSTQHKDLYIVDHRDGKKFHTIHSSDPVMNTVYPVDKVIRY